MKKIQKTKAFGIVEVLIASTVIMIAIFALASVSQVTLASTSRTMARAQAAHLAQEGIEIVRNIRDTNWIDDRGDTKWDYLVSIDGTAWSEVTRITNPAVADPNYIISYRNNRYFLSASGVGAGESISLGADKFIRRIKIEEVGAQMLNGVVPGGAEADKNEVAFKVSAYVTVVDGPTVVISEILTNWRPNY